MQQCIHTLECRKESFFPHFHGINDFFKEMQIFEKLLQI